MVEDNQITEFRSRGGCQAFTERNHVPLGVSQSLFSSVFDDDFFQHWYRRPCPWQLRLLGPPGSGKTTFAVLTVKWIRERTVDRNVRFASIFLQTGSLLSEDELCQAVVASLLHQFKNRGYKQQISVLSSNQDAERRLCETIEKLERAFLITDDVDVLPPTHFTKLNQLLSRLQRSGLSVIMTSRIPIPHDDGSRHPTCDINSAHTNARIHWCCAACYGKGANFDWANAQIVCERCRSDGRGCPTCLSSEHLHEPYQLIDLWLPASLSRDPAALPNYVAVALEVAHGDIGLDSQLPNLPPHSKLGKTITATQASETLDRICEVAMSNIAIAKLCLDNYQEAQVVEELSQIGDRLPDNILAVFDAQMDRVLQQSFTDTQLGINAIVAAMVDDDNSSLRRRPHFTQLQMRLQRKGLLPAPTRADPNRNLNQVLRASCGLLIIESVRECFVKPYHYLFGMYVVENYHERLYKARMAMTEPNSQE